MAEIIMGIDHGNGNMKGVHVNFPSEITEKVQNSTDYRTGLCVAA